CDFERVTVCDCDKRGDRVRVEYLKDEIEALRYVGVEEQKRKWSEVYYGLGDVVAKEYDCLVGFNDGFDGEGNYVSFDPRTQFGDKKGASSGKLFIFIFTTLLIVKSVVDDLLCSHC
ncbi:hypothetical protein Tco_1494484, partial [Tanacetum coccineum]